MTELIRSIIDFFTAIVKYFSNKSIKPEISSKKNDLPIVYVVLPTSKKGETMGDGLLQVAGFLAAGNAFKNIKIEARDHWNDEAEAKILLIKILEEEEKKKGPICIIYTMSDICEFIAGIFKEDIIKNKRWRKVAKRVNIIFTVASIKDKSLHDGKNLFHHFVTCDTETKRIVSHLNSIIRHIISDYDSKGLKPKGIMGKSALLYLSSRYPMETVSLLKNSFGSTVVFSEVPFNRKGESKHLDRIDEIAQVTGVDKRFVIIVAYDAALREAIKALKDAGYKGTVIATTTLSVKDWQEYLKKEEYLVPDIRLFYTYVEGFDSDNECSTFAENLEEWNFETIISQKESKYYKEPTEKIRQDFLDYDKYAAEIYKVIYPNYISAFCFDSVRIFADMHLKNAKSLSDVKMVESYKSEIQKHSPFGKNRIFENNGKTEISLYIGQV